MDFVNNIVKSIRTAVTGPDPKKNSTKKKATAKKTTAKKADPKKKTSTKTYSHTYTAQINII